MPQTSPVARARARPTGPADAPESRTRGFDQGRTPTLDQAESRRALERYELAMRATNEGIYDWDIPEDSIFFSPRAGEIFGLAGCEMSPTVWADRIHPEDYPAYRAEHVRHLRGETERFVCEYRFHTGSGDWRWVRQHGIARRDSAGRAIRLTGSVGDITEVKEAEARAARERDILEATLAHMEQGIFMADADGRLMAFNPRYQEMFDLPESLCHVGADTEGLLRHLFERGDLEEPWSVARHRYLGAETRSHGHTHEIARPDGTILEARTTVLPDGGFIRTFTDVSGRRRHERAITEILEAIPLPIIVSSTVDSTVYYVNSHAQEAYGLSVGSETGGSSLPLYVDPEDRRRLVDKVRKYRVVDDFEVLWRPLHDPDARVWVLLTAHAFSFQGHDAMLATAADITERKRMAAELQAAKDDAETALENLKATQASLIEAEKMASLGGLVAGVAHEINTPVGIAVTTATFLREKTEALKTVFETGKVRRSDFENYLGHALQSAELMLTSTNRAASLIQSFKQVAVDQTSDERRTFDLKSYMDEVLLSLGPRLKRTHHRMITDIPPDITVDGWPGPLSQVVTNFVMNSLMHAWGDDPAAAGTMTLTGTLVEDGRVVELRYSDDGRGIPPDHLPRIFEPFFTTRRGTGGSGLGLNIVFNIVRQTLKGTLEVDSQPSTGTTFIVRFPREACPS